jgi:hypothetical protein
VNVVSDGGDSTLMLRGNDPVAYFTAGRRSPGAPDLKPSTRRHLPLRQRREPRQFITRPTATRRSSAASAPSRWPTRAGRRRRRTFKIIDGKLYLFDSARARLYFEMDQERNLQLATTTGRPRSRTPQLALQSLKRLVFRVPNYKSNADLAEEYQRRFAGRRAERDKFKAGFPGGKQMTAWILNTASLFVTTIAVLLIFLYLYKAPRFARSRPRTSSPTTGTVSAWSSASAARRLAAGPGHRDPGVVANRGQSPISHAAARRAALPPYSITGRRATALIAE